MVGTYCTQRKPHLEEVNLESVRPRATVPKGMTKVAHNMSESVLAYQVMNNKAVTVIDNYYPYTLNEMERIARHRVIKNGLILPVGLSQYNDEMGGVNCVDNLKSGHYSLETINRIEKWNIKFFLIELLGLFFVSAWCIYRKLHPVD